MPKLASISFALLLAASAAVVSLKPEGTAARPTTAPSTAPAPVDLFDPARHMRVTEVRAGMKGYGLTVFSGTKIERFDVEVLSVLRNFNPGSDVVLITCKGATLEHSGAIAGMSGSPIYLKDDQGRDRMIGAFAYGWPMTKDPIAGVQPIEYMLKLPTVRAPADHVAGGAGPSTTPSRPARGKGRSSDIENGRPAWRMSDAAAQWQKLAQPAAKSGAAGHPLRLTETADAPRLEPLATPLMTTGLSPKLAERFGPALRSLGLTPMQAGAGGSGVPEEPPAELTPGSALAVTLMSGDVEMTAIGTTTEVLGDNVFGFGHPFNNEGAVSLPMGSGRINGVIPNLTTSFKLGSLTKQRGELSSDQTHGVAGRLGKSPVLVPIEVTVRRAGQADRTFHYEAVRHPKFTPLLVTLAFASSISGGSELPQFNTVGYAIDLGFDDGHALRIADTDTNANAAEMFQGVGITMTAAADNPFQRVMVKKVTATIDISPEVKDGTILEVNVPRLKYKPGETVKAFVVYQPFRSAEAVMPVELDLPKDLAEGTYQLVVSDGVRFAMDEQMTKPFHMTAERIEDVFDALKDLSSIRHDAVYLRLIRKSDGVAIGRTPMPQLPSSRRQVFTSAGRSNTVAFADSVTKKIPTGRVMAGGAEFQIRIESAGRAEAGAGAAGPSTRPTGKPPKPDAKPPKSGSLETP
jgi:hypothetical protein